MRKTSLQIKIKNTKFSISNFIRIEKKKYTNVIIDIYIFKCKKKLCNNILKTQQSAFKIKSAFCASCSAKNTRKFVIQKHQLPPFRALYNRFLTKVKISNKENKLTYKNFLIFTKILKCHYCKVKIDWKRKSSYNLDRIDNELPYSLYNCVVCCGLCNFTKRDEFTYKEFLKLGKVIKEIRKSRK